MNANVALWVLQFAKSTITKFIGLYVIAVFTACYGHKIK